MNGEPTIFHSGADSQGLALSGTIKVETTGDDDFIGFVLGYNTGDVTNASANYLLIDWKQGDQAYYGCTATAGLSISRVTGALSDGADTWCHTGAVEELARATTLGSTGWVDNTTYSFDLIFTATNVQVKVNGATELNISGSFSNGAFGFYNCSQEKVSYAGLTEEDVAPPVPAVPLPAGGLLLVTSLAGVAALRRRRR